MPTFDSRIDDYISRSTAFAQPILHHIRNLVHKACPQVQEAIKWSFPHFEYKGAILCSMAAFKQHCAFTFWYAVLMKDPNKILAAVGEKTSMGHLGPVKGVEDLPADDVLSRYINEAMELIDHGVKIPKKEKAVTGNATEVPGYFLDELKKTRKRFKHFKTSALHTKKNM